MTARRAVAVLALAALAPLAACAPDAGAKRNILGPLFFACDDGPLLTLRFDLDDATARITGASDTPLVLRRISGASGFWYVDGLYSLRGKGREATWQAPGRSPATCRTGSPLIDRLPRG